MHTPSAPQATVRRVRDGSPDRPDYRKVRRALAAETIHRVVPGSFVLKHEWDALTPIERHRLRVVETVDRMRAPAVLSHFAAAAVHDMDILGPWPERVDVRVPPAGGGRSSGLVRRHAVGVDDLELHEWRGHYVTSPTQTAIDIAAISDHLHAVVVLDQLLWERRPGGPLASLDELVALTQTNAPVKGGARVRHAVAAATGASDSVRESQSRILIRRLGFPQPVLQREFILPDRSLVRTDFYFPDQDHVGEFDGLGKYLDPALLAGRTPEEALIAEKDRADALSRIVRRVSRWRTPALRDPRKLYDILIADGLPSALPRPTSRRISD